jgi:DNA-binding transcriptional ArsR family regulator
LQESKRENAAQQTEAIFGALAHPSRREILMVLNFRGGRMTAGEIAERFSCRWPTTTRHLGVLLQADLVRLEKRGRQRIYQLNLELLQQSVGNWLGWFVQKPAKSRAKKAVRSVHGL